MAAVKLFVKKTKNALVACKEKPTLLPESIKECRKRLRILRAKLERARTSRTKCNITSARRHLLSYLEQMKELLRREPRKGVKSPKSVKWMDEQTAFKSRIRTGRIANLTHKEPKSFIQSCFKLFEKKIEDVLKKKTALKVNAILCGEFKINKNDKELIELKYIKTKNYPIYRDTNTAEWFEEYIQAPILRDLEEFQKRDSGWTLSSISNLAININQYTQLLGSSYIELPDKIKTKQACINVQNDDNECFKWAVLAALHPPLKHPQRVRKYEKYRNELDFTGINFPMSIEQIPRFEKQNQISINVFILKKANGNYETVPCYKTKDKKERHVSLLLIQNVYYDENEDQEQEDEANQEEPIRYHYVWIKSLSRLVSRQLSKKGNAKHFCDRCLHYFHTKDKLEKHIEDCKDINRCKILLPTEDQKYLKFKNYQNQIKAPFIIYADLECLLKDTNDSKHYQRHIPCSIGYYFKCSYDPKKSYYKFDRGENCIEWFMNELKDIVAKLEQILWQPLPMNRLTAKQKQNFKNAILCYICEEPFVENNKKVHDHCHFTGEYRGPAHENCNLRLKFSRTVPVAFHNLSGYDSHFILRNLASDIEGRINVLSINKERFISFTKHISKYKTKFRFIDSFKFMASGLDALSSTLTSFPILRSEFHQLSENQFKLLTRKGIYPYDYFDSHTKFSEVSLPSIRHFYSKLNGTHISDEDYSHACKVWNDLNIQNLGDYSDLYLKTDVLLLADIFEQFRSSCYKTHHLDPAHYYTLPGYTWDAMFKFTKVTLELITDIDMMMFIERGIRGGLSQCSKRYAKANNKYMSGYDQTKPSNFLAYFDINNQYGWAMSQYLPKGNFKWVENVQDFNVCNITDDSPTGYILEVDLEYPREIHDHHKDLPFCPNHDTAPESNQKKLMATLKSKEKYVIHYRYLKQALKHGLKLKRIHRILEFNQSPWLEPYINYNTRLRMSAVNDFEKNLFKLKNNAVFGKTMENVRNHSNVKLKTEWSGRYGAEAMISKPEFNNCTILDENLVVIELNKTKVYLNKPIYVGMCILDLAKTKIYEFHYDYMLPKFSTNSTICYTDTDSLVYEVKCPDLYDIIKRDCFTHFDTSDYPSDNIYNIPLVNKKVLGFMKDENNGRIMTEFVGLRSKMYSIRVEEKDNVKKAKGVKRHVVKTQITFDDYVECLKNNIEKSISQNYIVSQNHNVHSVRQVKTALSPHDDKRYLIKDSYETLPWGHHSIMEID